VPIPLATSAFLERQPVVTPDGKYLAYTSNETGRPEIHVRPFPKVAGGKWVISTAGGSDPFWSRDGKEMFYRNGNGDMIAVEVVPGGTPPTGRQRVLFSARPYASVPVHQSYDVSPDGKRFVMIRLSTDRGAPLVVVENFFEELKRKVPR
jgi:Tol biopolymer transport system component